MEAQQLPIRMELDKVPETLALRLGAAAWQAMVACMEQQKEDEGGGKLKRECKAQEPLEEKADAIR